MDPFEHFGEEEMSWTLLKERGPMLVEEARDVMVETPGAQPVGIILTADSPAAEIFLAPLREREPEARIEGVSALVAPSHARTILNLYNPDRQEWLEEQIEERGRLLPVIVGTKNGYRLGTFPLAVEEEEEETG